MLFLSAVMPNHLPVREWVDPENLAATSTLTERVNLPVKTLILTDYCQPGRYDPKSKSWSGTHPMSKPDFRLQVRMIKVQQKVSGCFRSTDGADHFCRIRGYISTLRKQGGHILLALRSVFMGDPIYPCLDTPGP